MQDQTFVHDPNIERLVHDFDALADLLHRLIEQDRQAEVHHDGLYNSPIAFTTEWQMVGSAEEVHSA